MRVRVRVRMKKIIITPTVSQQMEGLSLIARQREEQHLRIAFY